MSATRPLAAMEGQSVPQLTFSIEDSEPVRFAAQPTLRFGLRIASVGGGAIRSVMLDTQIQIAARRRSYDQGAHDRLFELFGRTEDWSTTLRTLAWTRTTMVVPPFTDTTLVDLLVPCSYDLEVIASRYIDSLADGEVPLEFLFSGTLFYSAPNGMLQTGRIGWDQDADYRMPVSVWKDTMDHYFPQSAWLRLSKQSFDRLSAYKSRNAIATWDDALDSLLGAREEPGS